MHTTPVEASRITRLFAFDFDNTLIDGHAHNMLKLFDVKPGKGAEKMYLSKIMAEIPLKHKEKICVSIKAHDFDPRPLFV